LDNKRLLSGIGRLNKLGAALVSDPIFPGRCEVREDNALGSPVIQKPLGGDFDHGSVQIRPELRTEG
jgi:hypothetical protein